MEMNTVEPEIKLEECVFGPMTAITGGNNDVSCLVTEQKM